MNIYKHNRLPSLGIVSEREVVDEFRRVERWATRVNGYLSEDIMKWAGSWGGYGTSYVKGDVVTNGEWTMVANKETTEYPFPQAATDIAWAVFGDAIPAWVAQSTSTTRLLTGIRITPDYVAVVQALRVWIPLIDPDVGYYIFSQVEGQVPKYEHIFPTETGWFPVTFSAAALATGVPVEIYLVTQGQGTTSETFTYNWTYRLSSANPNPDNPPVVGQFRHFTTNAPDVAYLNKTDNDGFSRKGQLDTLRAGDTIAWTDSGGVDVFFTLTADPVYHNSAVGEEDFYELHLSPAVGQGSNGTVAMTFTHFLDRPTSYVQVTDRFLGVDGAKGLLSTTGNIADVVQTDDAYGIDVLYQEVSFPVDWDVVAYSGGVGGTGGSTEEPTIPNHNALPNVNVLASGHTADVLNYSNISSGLAAATVQAAIDEVAAETVIIPNHNALPNVNVLASGHTADALNYSNISSGLAANTVQAAIDEVAASSGGGPTGYGGLTWSDETGNPLSLTDDVWSNVVPGSGVSAMSPNRNAIVTLAGMVRFTADIGDMTRVILHGTVYFDAPTGDTDDALELSFALGTLASTGTPIGNPMRFRLSEQSAAVGGYCATVSLSIHDSGANYTDTAHAYRLIVRSTRGNLTLNVRALYFRAEYE